MIRFIDLSGQIYLDTDDTHFAFYDTVTSRFLSIGEEQDWETRREFLDAVNRSKFPQRMKDRLVHLVPPEYFRSRG